MAALSSMADCINSSQVTAGSEPTIRSTQQISSDQLLAYSEQISSRHVIVNSEQIKVFADEIGSEQMTSGSEQQLNDADAQRAMDLSSVSVVAENMT